MSTSQKASPKKKRRPLRKLLVLAVLAGIVVAIKNALEDKGGSYEAPATPAEVPTPPAPAPFTDPESNAVETAEEILDRRPVEDLAEFADPIEPATTAIPVDDIDTVAADEPQDAPTEEETRPARRSRRRSALAEALEEEPEDVADAARKIDPFGIR